MHLAAQRVFQILVGKRVKLFQHAIHAAFADSVQAVGRGSHGREADLVKAEVLFQVAEDPDDVGDAAGERDARGDGPRTVVLNQGLHARGDDVITAVAVGEDAELIVQFGRAIHADGHADAVLGEELDDGRRRAAWRWW